MDRRNFLALGGVAAVTGSGIVNAEGAAASRHRPAGKLLMRRIPSSGETIPAIGLGTSGPFEVGADEAARAPLREVLQGFFAGGGTLIDTSPMYSTAEAVLGDLLTRRPAGQSLHRHQGVDAGIGWARRTKGHRADAAFHGAAQAQAHRPHAGAQPRRSRRAPEDAAALEGRGQDQVHRRHALHHQLLSRPHRHHRTREARLRAVQLLGDHARSREAPAAAVRGQGRRGAGESRLRRRQPVHAGAGQGAARLGGGVRRDRAGRRCSSSSCWRTRP